METILKIKLFIECWKLARRSNKGIKTAVAIYREQMLLLTRGTND